MSHRPGDRIGREAGSPERIRDERQLVTDRRAEFRAEQPDNDLGVGLNGRGQRGAEHADHLHPPVYLRHAQQRNLGAGCKRRRLSAKPFHPAQPA